MAMALTLSESQLATLETALYDDDDAVRSDAIARLTTSAELHAFASHYNWDDGVDGLRHVIESPSCDSGTALMIYWLTDGLFARERPRAGGEVWDLVIDIERRYLAGFYRNQEYSFDPRDPNDLDGDWQLALANAKRTVPDAMTRSTPGRPVDVSWEALRASSVIG